MQKLVNLMEAIRYLSDSHPAKMETSSLSALSIATRAAGLLIQHLGEDNQRLILACLIFGFGTESLDQEELRQLFGGKVMEYLSITGSLKNWPFVSCSD